jgi:predicted RNA polymerase sigma factor
LGRSAEAHEAYQEALLLSENEVERSFLADRLNQVGR